MKAKAVIAHHVTAELDDLSSQQPDPGHSSENQEAIKSKHLQESGISADFPHEDIESSVTKRFEKIAREYPDRLAVKASGRKWGQVRF